MNDSQTFFSALSGESMSPHAWQRELAGDATPRSGLVRIPTGMGTLGVVAALLKLAEKTAYAMAQAGEIPSFKIRGRIERTELEQWIDAQPRGGDGGRDGE